MPDSKRATASGGKLSADARRLSFALPPLMIEAERVANTVRAGLHGKRRAGLGETFWQFRDYAQGDATTRIDWRQSARSDRLFIREREWETAQQVYLWADASGSMRYASQKDLPEKIERARLLMLALTHLLLRGGEKPVWLTREPITVSNNGGLERLASQFILENENENRPPELALARHACILLASDFLMPPEELHKLIARYASLNLKGGLIHILDPAEEDLPFEGRIEMQGLEQEPPLLLANAGALREAYRAQMAAHKTRLMQYAKNAGWFYIRHTTSEAPVHTLMQIYPLLANRQGF